MLKETVLAAVLVFAVLALITAVKRRVRPRAPGLRGVEIYTLIRASGGAEGLEEAVRRAGERVIIADAGLEPEARRRAELLAQRAGGAVVRGDGNYFTD